MPDFLLELRSEEIPARMQAKAREDLARLFTAELTAAGIAPGEIVTYATPRRLALIARDLPAETAASSEEVKGPRASAPPQALEGFLRKTGLTRDQLTERDGVLYAVTDKPGRAVLDLFAHAIPAIVRAFPWPKSMRWGAASTSTDSLRWVRPLQGIVALFGEDIVPCQIAGVPAGAATVGHRFHHPGPITLRGADDYVEKLRACHVVVDPAERAQIIALGATLAAQKAGLTLVRDEGLLAENAGLTEWPVPLFGRFDEAFLDVPPEVIQLTARVNQKYFVCHDVQGKLANAFICTANIDADDDGARIVEGNRKVLAARLSDARFFYDQDLKVPLEEQAMKLDRIVFHEKLGTVADKVDRVAKLAEWLATEGIVPDCDPALAKRAAELCKADLVTGMVGEFPELQGLMGGYYAAAQGEHPAVAQAIRDHYKPVGQGDAVPTAPVTVAVSLADKLDTIVGCFLLDKGPTGSRDPFALRRAAIAVIAQILKAQIRCSLQIVLEQAIKAYFALPRSDTNSLELQATREIEPGAKLQPYFLGFTETHDAELNRLTERWVYCHIDFDRDWKRFRVNSTFDDVPVGEIVEEGDFLWEEYYSYDETYPKLRSFFADRLKVQQREAGVRHDLIDAVFALGGEDDLVRLLARVRALQGFVGTEDGANLLTGYKRAANILKKEGWTGTGQGAEKLLSYTPEPEEGRLASALDLAEPTATAAIQAEEFATAMTALASLRAPIDAFFDKVTVNDPDPAKREARLALLARVRHAVHSVADFSKIEG